MGSCQVNLQCMTPGRFKGKYATRVAMNLKRKPVMNSSLTVQVKYKMLVLEGVNFVAY